MVRKAICLILLAYGLLGLPSLPSREDGGQSVSIQEPSPEMLSVVRPVIKAVSSMSAIDRLWLQHIYLNAARVVRADGTEEPTVIQTTTALRAVHVAILSFIWNGMAENSPGKYEGLDAAVNQAFNAVVGDDERGLTPEMREKAAKMFEAIAWAGLGKDG